MPTFGALWVRGRITLTVNVSDRSYNGTSSVSLPEGPWIALIRRGVCKFEDKVKNVYNNNAIGVIVYNDRESQNLDKMQIADKERE